MRIVRRVVGASGIGALITDGMVTWAAVSQRPRPTQQTEQKSNRLRANTARPAGTAVLAPEVPGLEDR